VEDALTIAAAILELDDIGNTVRVPFGNDTDAEKAAAAEELLQFLMDLVGLDVTIAVTPDGSGDFDVRITTAGGVSDTVSPFCVEVSPLPVPENVTATAGNGQITLSWAAPLSDGGSPITGYSIQVGSGNPILLPATQTSTTISGLTNGTQYSITVAAVNALGTGDAATVYATPVAPPPPSSSNSGGGSSSPAAPKREEHAPYMFGDNLGNFNPDGNMTRAEVAQMLYNLLGTTSAPAQTKSYSDVDADNWCYDAVMALSAMGVITGYEDGTFRPDAPTSRSEFAALLVRFVEVTAKKTLSLGSRTFSDVPAEHWASEYISAMSATVWMIGYDSAFKPEQSISRAEATEAINAMLGRVADESYFDSHPEMNPFSDVSDDHWAYYEIMEASVKHECVVA